jgi:hypothetical protein
MKNKKAIKITIQFGSCRENKDGFAGEFKPTPKTEWRAYITEEIIAQTKDGGLEKVKENAGKAFKWALLEDQ